MKWFVLGLIAFFGVLWGLFAGLFGGLLALLLFVPMSLAALVLWDYRAGVIGAAILLPWIATTLLPHVNGVVVVLSAITVFIYLAGALLGRRKILELPRQLVWFYLVPFTFAVLTAWPHLRQAADNLAGTPGALSYAPDAFIVGYFLKPLAYVVFAWLLGNAVRESRKPERFLACFVFAAALPALGVFALIALYRVPLADLQAQRNFLAPLGVHANEMAIMLVYAVGPVLFMLNALKGLWARLFSVLALLFIASALLLTFSRGGFVALVIVIGFYVIQARRVGTLLIALSLMCVGLLFAPDAVRERLTTGVETGAVQYSVGNMTDPLTAGRVAVWQRLAPEFLRSPIWGSGLNSTVRSELVRTSSFKADHPHNMYLAALLDVGILGFGLLACWYWWVFKAYRQLSHAASLSPLMRRFFAGSAASLAGMVAMYFTNGNYTPKPEYTFFWFSVGMMFAYRNLLQPQSQSRARTAHRWGASPSVGELATKRSPVEAGARQ